MKTKIIHKEMSKERFIKVYLCNQAVIVNPDKRAILDKDITCKNCRRILQKKIGNIWDS
jgi:hypothetical protein